MKRKRGFIFLALGIVLLVSASCDKVINEMSVIRTLKTALDEDSIESFVFSNDQGNSILVVPEFGGRIWAASVGGENLFWTHPLIFRGQGGQRSWISPEGGDKGFIFKPDWSGTWNFSMMDPGVYEVTHHEEGTRIVLANSFGTASNDELEHYELTLTRDIKLLKDPLLANQELKKLSYQYLGIDFIHKLRNDGDNHLDKLLALWCLIQVPPKGTMIVPVKEIKEDAWRGNYFEPTPSEYAAANSDSYSFFLHGSQRYKIGLPPDVIQGKICYLRKGKGLRSTLIIMTFPYKGDASYPDRPKNEQDTNGDAIQIYSHLEEEELAFGELECHSWALDLPSGAEEAFPIKIMMYKAPLKVLHKIGEELVCEGFASAHLF